MFSIKIRPRANSGTKAIHGFIVVGSLASTAITGKGNLSKRGKGMFGTTSLRSGKNDPLKGNNLPWQLKEIALVAPP